MKDIIATVTVRSLLALCAFASMAAAQVPQNPWYDRAHSWSLTEENDALTISGDSAYTQGLRLQFEYAWWNTHWNTTFGVTSFSAIAKKFYPRIDSIRGPCTGIAGYSARPCGTFGFGIGQTMYTPEDLTIPARQLNQRPYAGFLFLDYVWSVLYPHAHISTQVIAGVTGPPSLGQDAQSLVHWSLSTASPQPQGWGNQLKSMPQLTLLNSYSGRPSFLEYCAKQCDGSYGEMRIVDVTPRAELAVGTPMTRASLGGMIRLGYGFPDIMNAERVPISRGPMALGGGTLWQKVKDAQWWIFGFMGYDERAIAWNWLITGSPADGGPDGWRTRRTIDLVPLVGESSYGLTVGSSYATLVFQSITRSVEYHPSNGSHTFGSITLSVHSSQAAPRAP
jgi:lipid A 3-O-deacylase